MGKFLTRDPIGYAGRANLYGFAGGNPVNESDPSGTTYEDAIKAIATNRNDVVRVARSFGLQPELLAGVVWNEMDPEENLPNWNQVKCRLPM